MRSLLRGEPLRWIVNWCDMNSANVPWQEKKASAYSCLRSWHRTFMSMAAATMSRSCVIVEGGTDFKKCVICVNLYRRNLDIREVLKHRMLVFASLGISRSTSHKRTHGVWMAPLINRIYVFSTTRNTCLNLSLPHPRAHCLTVGGNDGWFQRWPGARHGSVHGVRLFLFRTWRHLD